MERAIKQRILGAIVLLTGCAVLLPVVLDGSGTLHQMHEVPMPPRPSLPPPAAAQLPWTPPATVASLPPPPPVAPPAAAAALATVPAAGAPAVTMPSLKMSPGAEPQQAQPVARKAPQVLEHRPVRAVAAPVQADLRPAPVAQVPWTGKPEERDPVDMLPDMWTVQVASLNSEAAAIELKSKLEHAHEHAYTRHVGKFFKVFVGPQLSKVKAEKTKQDLQTQGIQGWLQPYAVQ